jgi:two-component system sensor histidine kinase MprB
MRTNIELLLADTAMPKDERRRILADVLEQTEELTALIGDLIELARGDLPPGEVEDVRLDEVVEGSLERARRNFPNIRFEASVEPVVVMGVPDRLGRAVNNLLDNAARHSPSAGTVEITAGPRGVRVRDHGNGVDPEDLPYVFDRFYRGASSRGRQGSGLGLAIVRQVADQQGGSVAVENAPDGGAVFTLRLPVVPGDVAPDGAPSAGRPDDPSLARGPEALA